MLDRAEFSRFRGFERMRVDLAPNGYIVGPNSAGKSTVIESIAFAERCLLHARRKGPTHRVFHRGEERKAYALPGLGEDVMDDPVRFDFGRDEARASIYWQNGAAIHMVWPAQTSETDHPFFYLDTGEGLAPRSVVAVKELFQPITVVPVVTPLDRVEEMKNADYVRRLVGSRLASRHFRNHAFHMQQEGSWQDFKTFAATWLPEIELLDVSFDAGANQLGVFYREQGSRVPKELAWAGDGIQIWLQLLWHLSRAEACGVIVLDEPEVYLHPDLQRRLVRLLDGLNAQVILASHSAEVIAEAPPESVVWIDRRTHRAKKATSDATLSALGASIGSSYNIALARSSRVRLVLATDTQDLRLLRLLARHVGALHIANEQAVSIVPLRHASAWTGVEGLGATLREALPPAIPAIILLEPGQRSDVSNQQIAASLDAPSIEVRFWSRSELTNYVLDPDAIARASGAAPEASYDHLLEAVEDLRDATRSEVAAESVRSASVDESIEKLVGAGAEFDRNWSTEEYRMRVVSGTQVLSRLNGWLGRDGYRAISGYSLGRSARPHALAAEVFSVLLDVDEKAG